MSVRVTDEQARVIAHGDGPAMTVAVAGAGKTTTLVLRIKRLIESGVPPRGILVATFSRLGAADIRKRAAELGVQAGFDCRTLHGVARMMFFDAWRQPRASKLPSDAQVKAILQKALQQVSMHGRSRGEASSLDAAESLPESVLSEMDLAKAWLIEPDEWKAADGTRFPPYLEWASKRGVQAPLARVVDFCYRNYREVTRNPAAYGIFGADHGTQWDGHDDIVAYVAKAILQDDFAAETWRGRWTHMIVDEVQDNSTGQWVISEHVVRSRNIMVCGDDWQSIFRWRGARPELLLDFMQRHGPSLSFYRMTRNFRCSQRILDAANGILERARGRLIRDPLVRGREDEASAGGEVGVRAYADRMAEAAGVVDAIHGDIRAGGRPGDIAVLYRINATSGPLEFALIRERIPYRVAGKSFFSSKLVQSAIAWLAVARDEGDQEPWQKWVWRTPTRYLRRDFLTEFPTLKSLRDANRSRLGKWRGARRILEDADLVREGLASGGTRSALWAAFHSVGLREHLREEAFAEESGSSAEEVDEGVRALLSCAEAIPDPAEFMAFVRGKAEGVEDRDGEKMSKGENSVTLSTVHRCVSPDTLVETDRGLVRIDQAPKTGLVATAIGPARYVDVPRFGSGELIRIETHGGYSVTVTPDHRLMAWTGESYQLVRASALTNKMFLRLKLGVTQEPLEPPELPAAPADLDVRAKVHRVPTGMTADLAEFLGLMVGDGTAFARGIRLTKRHREVVDRFETLARALFGCVVIRRELPLRTPNRNLAGDVLHCAEVCSVMISRWLLSFDGIAPNAKDIPSAIMRSDSEIQAAFLRGLFEDGAVARSAANELECVDWSSSYEPMARKVQLLLLRLGMISSLRKVGSKRQWHVYVYGAQAKEFERKVGLISRHKRATLALPLGPKPDRLYVVPVPKDRVLLDGSGFRKSARTNSRSRGYLSRYAIKRLGAVGDELEFHHDRIVRLDRLHGPSICLEVPSVGRFLQNGFDGSNSKGLEWRNVYLIGMSDGLFPLSGEEPEDENRLAYVAFTRAKDKLVASWARAGKGERDAEPSPFLEMAGLVGARPAAPPEPAGKPCKAGKPNGDRKKPQGVARVKTEAERRALLEAAFGPSSGRARKTQPGA